MVRIVLVCMVVAVPARADFFDDVRRTFQKDIPRTFEQDIPRAFGANPKKTPEDPKRAADSPKPPPAPLPIKK